MEKLHISMPVIVEGKYDKIKLDSIIDAEIFTTGGFSLFREKKKLSFIKKISDKGVIVLTDSDGAGTLIRSHITSAVPPDKIYQLYIPQIKGKEKRKKYASAEGTLGVEGIDADILRKLFLPFANGAAPKRDRITKTDLYEAGLTGLAQSSQRRAELCGQLGLPDKMSVNAMLSALNVILDREQFFKVSEKLGGGNSKE